MPKSAKGAPRAIKDLAPNTTDVKGGFFGALLKKVKKAATS